MKNNAGLFKIEERDNGDVLWNGFRVEKIGGNKIKINENVFDITRGIQKVLTHTSNIPIKKLNVQDSEIFNSFLESLILRIMNQYVVNLNQEDINNLKRILKIII